MEKLKPEVRAKYNSLEEKLKNITASPPSRVAEHALAKYLYEIGQKVTDEFYKTMIIFVKLYKESLNEYGWELISKKRKVTIEEKKKEFVKEDNTAEFIPDMCNDFINYFLPQEFPAFDKLLAIELVRHLCDWINKNGYTRKQILLL